MSQEAKRKWRLRNPEKVKAAKRRWGIRYYHRNQFSRRMYSQLFCLAFPEKAKAIKQAEYLKNILRYKASARQWNFDNAEYLREHRRRYNRNNRDLNRERVRRFHAANPGYRKALNAHRRNIRRKTSVLDLPAIAKIYKRASELRKWFDVVVDHVIPLAKGGSHSPSNLQIIYRTENYSKSAKLDYTSKVIFS